jgi:hypothetical protein
MAHTVTTQVLEEGVKFTVIKVNIKGDSGTAAELTKAILFDASAYSDHTADKLFDIEYCLNDFSAELFWDASSDVPLMSLAKTYPYRGSYIVGEGGLKNNGGAGVTGDILITTNGLTSSTKDGHIILRISWR